MLLSNGTATPIPSAALAELTPQVQQGWYYPTSTGLSLERSFVLYNSLYRFQPWIRTVVDKIANAVARLTINVWDIAQTAEGATLRTLDTKSPYAALIANPNDQMDPYRFWQWVAATIEIYGEAYLLKVRTGRRVTSLIPMHPSRIVVVRHPDTGEELYLWNGAAGSDGMLTFTSDEVIPLRLYSPEGAERGLSRLESLRSTLFSEDSSRTATSAMWRNAGMPNFMITSPKKLSQDASDRLRKQFDSIHAGSQNAGKTLVLEEGMEVKPVQLTAVEMQFIQSRQLNREEICGVYDIAEPMVQILDRATFSNISAQMRAFYRDTMAPRLELIESALNAGLGGNFNGSKRVEFAVADVLRGDYETRGAAVAQLVQVGVMKPAEGRQLMDLSDGGEVADRLYANSAIQPLGAAPDGQPAGAGPSSEQPALEPAEDADEPTDTDEPDEEPKGLIVAKTATQTRYVRAVKGVIGRGARDAEIRALAVKLAARNPGDLEDILRAVQIAIEERDS